MLWRLCAFLMERCPDYDKPFRNDRRVSEWEESKKSKGSHEFEKYLLLGCIRASHDVLGLSAVQEEHIRDLDTPEARKAELLYEMVLEAWREVTGPPQGLIADSKRTQRLCDDLLKSLNVIFYGTRRKLSTVLSAKHGDIIIKSPTQLLLSLEEPLVSTRTLDSVIAEAESDFSRGIPHRTESRKTKLTNIARSIGRILNREELAYLAEKDGQEIVIDASHIGMPIEIARLRGRFLASRHVMSRCFNMAEVRTREGPWPASNERILFVGDPSHTLRFDLVERMIFEDILHDFADHDIPIDVHDSVDRDGFLGILNSQNYGLLHFSGHGGVGTDGVPFLLLADGQRLSSDDIRVVKPPSGFPRLVVLNACLSASGDTDVKVHGASGYESFRRGFASAFLTSGTRAFVGTLWPVADKCAAAFAEQFYRFLFGHQMDIDESMWRAKRCLLGEKNSIDALAYVLFKYSPRDSLSFLTKRWKLGGSPRF